MVAKIIKFLVIALNKSYIVPFILLFRQPNKSFYHHLYVLNELCNSSGAIRN